MYSVRFNFNFEFQLIDVSDKTLQINYKHLHKFRDTYSKNRGVHLKAMLVQVWTPQMILRNNE